MVCSTRKRNGPATGISFRTRLGRGLAADPPDAVGNTMGTISSASMCRLMRVPSGSASIPSSVVTSPLTGSQRCGVPLVESPKWTVWACERWFSSRYRSPSSSLRCNAQRPSLPGSAATSGRRASMSIGIRVCTLGAKPARPPPRCCRQKPDASWAFSKQSSPSSPWTSVAIAGSSDPCSMEWRGSPPWKMTRPPARANCTA